MLLHDSPCIIVERTYKSRVLAVSARKSDITRMRNSRGAINLDYTETLMIQKKISKLSAVSTPPIIIIILSCK